MATTKDKFASYSKEVKENFNKKTRIIVSMGTCGLAAGATDIMESLKGTLKSAKLGNDVELVESGCMGLCYAEPTIEVIPAGETIGTYYGNVTVASSDAFISSKGGVVKGHTPIHRDWSFPEEEEQNGKAQVRIVLKNSGKINPEKIEDYIASGGYSGMIDALLNKQPKDIVKEILDSGLRGRGGGGFPTGKKWEIAAIQKSKEKYVVCNADEGDPGAFMDRAVLEGDPHAVLEAMAIAGYAIGASNGVIYIRAEYPLAIKRLRIAIEQAEKQGLLGKKVLGTKFSFDIDIKFGAGAFVCGEETALINSIEGKRGEPVFKPPFPAVEGLWKKPTIVNNVETLANVSAIIKNGAKWFRKTGSETCPGTKVFALAGKINNVGLVEVPMGTTLKDIIYKIGNGIRDGKSFKAVQTGGPSGGCLIENQLDNPIDYETLRGMGSMMGSGGMIVMDEDDCMVNIAKYFLDFTLDESCGKCTACRIGNKRLYEMLSDICNGKATEETLVKLQDLSATVKDTSLCGLGQTSPNPIISTMAQFPDEYKAHVIDKKCPSKVCKDLLTFTVIADKCIGCTICAKHCPVDCISGNRKEAHVIDSDACIKCGVCYDACKFHAIEKK